MTIVAAIVFALVLAVIVGIFIIRKANKAEERAKLSKLLKDVKLHCPSCSALFDADPAWKRHRPLRGGDMFTCPACGHSSVWDLDMKPPKLKAGRVH